MDLSIIVVSYQNKGLLERCLQSVLDHLVGVLEFEVWVVDNASTDGTVPWLTAFAAKNPQIRPLFNSENRGFSGGNNPALRVCQGEYVLLLNSDALLIDTSVLEGMAFLKNRPGAFGCAALLLNPDGSSGVSYGHFPGLRTLARELMQARFGRLRGVVPRADEPAHPVDFPCGAWFLVSAAGLKKVGLLDEAYFLYFEETDWAKRARNLGMTLHYLPACKAIHIGGGSSENQTPLAIIATFYESWFLYVRKHSVWGAPALLFLLLFPYLLLRTGFSGLRRRRESTRLQTRHVKALFWALTGKPSRSLAAGKFK